ncbi:MAG: J domain-containing protein [Candidatus Thermoplasmatota archaeon]
MRLVLDPTCPDARALAAQHDQRASLLAGAPGSRLGNIVAEERTRAYREHQFLCARCLNYATPCRRCGHDARKHSMLCSARWRRVTQAPPKPSVRPARHVATTGTPAQATPIERRKRSSHDVLGVPRDASPEMLRQAYHERAMEYHPDRTAGLAPELRKLAEERMREINEAYRRASNGLL